MNSDQVFIDGVRALHLQVLSMFRIPPHCCRQTIPQVYSVGLQIGLSFEALQSCLGFTRSRLAAQQEKERRSRELTRLWLEQRVRMPCEHNLVME